MEFNTNVPVYVPVYFIHTTPFSISTVYSYSLGNTDNTNTTTITSVFQIMSSSQMYHDEYGDLTSQQFLVNGNIGNFNGEVPISGLSKEALSHSKRARAESLSTENESQAHHNEKSKHINHTSKKRPRGRPKIIRSGQEALDVSYFYFVYSNIYLLNCGFEICS